jgi:cellulose synthase/poly-beta-1,6-N-acetylglucosamine synthase-like glycosyltransferase
VGRVRGAPQSAMELLPVQLLCLLVLMNRYVLGPFLRRIRQEPVDRKDPSIEPSVAIVVPLYNEGEGIYRTILSLAEQEYPKDKLEVVVVDDCSTDDSYSWALRAARADRRITVLRNAQNLGKRKSINRAVLATSAEVIVSVDSDVVADKRAVRELVARFVSPEIAAVGGRTFVQGHERNWLTRMVAVKFFFSQEWLKELERVFCTVMCLTGCLTAYRRKVLLELHDVLENRSIAGVSIKYGEDRFLTRQIVKAGYKTVLTLDAFCYTAAPDTLSGYFAQQLRWRRSNLVDFFGGLTHAWKLHPLVCLHYLSVLALIVAYPVVILHNLITGWFWDVILFHLGVVALLGVVYRFETRHLPASQRVPAFSFLPMAVVMPVSYVLLTPLALFTLDSGSWETRRAAAPAPVLTPVAAPA